MLILGPPGCGKTYHLTNEVIPNLEGKICILSFTRSGAKEIGSRLKDDAEFVGTLHSFCFRELNLLSGQVLDSYEMFLKTFQGVESQVKDALAAYDFARQTFSKVTSDKVHNLVIQKYETFKEATGLWDFTDMLEACRGREIGSSFDYIVIDEAQDMTPLQWKVIFNIPHKKMIAAGDDDQAIFEWTGASALRDLKDMEKKVLDQSYRLPRKIFDYSREVLTRISSRREKEYKPTSEEGEVVFLSNLPHLLAMKENATILVRDNYLKADIIDYLMSQNVPVKSVLKGKYYKAWFKDKEVPLKYKMYFKRVDLDADTIFEVRTIHKSKGMEWDNVCVVAQFSGKVEESLHSRRGKDAEARNWYVAVTRAKKKLFICGHNTFLPRWSFK